MINQVDAGEIRSNFNHLMNRHWEFISDDRWQTPQNQVVAPRGRWRSCVSPFNADRSEMKICSEMTDERNNT